MIGLGAFTLAVIGIGAALKIAAPGLKVFADAVVDIADIIEQTKPIGFLLENVEGLIKHDKGNTFRIILNTFMYYIFIN